MATVRFRSRFLHATVYHFLSSELDARGWITPPVNFSTASVTMIDYQPEERSQQVAFNTVAVSLGDYASDDDEELGASFGGLRSANYSVFIDVYMAEQALSFAICDDIRDVFTDRSLLLVDQITQLPTDDRIEVEMVEGPIKVSGTAGEPFRKHWRTMRIDCRLFFLT